ncbi:MAG: hypothetical protein V4510_07075 [bacterium]
MSNPPWMVTLVVPAELRERLEERKLHRRQPFHEVIRLALDVAEERLPSQRLDPPL